MKKHINALWASLVKLFAWRRLTVAEVIASWRRYGDEWVTVTWVNSRGRNITSAVPRRRIRVSDAISAPILVEVRWGSARVTMQLEQFREQIQSWDKLRQRRSEAS